MLKVSAGAVAKLRGQLTDTKSFEDRESVSAITVKVPDPLPLFHVTVSNVICRMC